MDAFIRKYQPDRYELWLEGKDIGPHPENPLHISAAPLPDFVLTNKTKSKRQAVANKSKSKNETEDCQDSDDTACLNKPIDTDYCKQSKLLPSTSSNKPESFLASQVKHPIVLIKRNPQLMSFMSSSALDQLSEDTKLNVSIPVNKQNDKLNSDSTNINSNNNNNNNSTNNTNDNSSNSVTNQFFSVSTASPSTFKTKAALKIYENTFQPTEQPSFNNRPMINFKKRPLDDDNSSCNEQKKVKKDPLDWKSCFPNLTSKSSTINHSGIF